MFMVLLLAGATCGATTFLPADYAQVAEARREGDIERAVEILLQLAESDDPAVAEVALFNAGLQLEWAGRIEAEQLYMRFLREYPEQTDRVAYVYWKLGYLRLGQVDLEGALHWFELLYNEYPAYVDAGWAIYMAGLIQYTLGNHRESASLFEAAAAWPGFNRREQEQALWAAVSVWERVGDAELRDAYLRYLALDTDEDAGNRVLAFHGLWRLSGSQEYAEGAMDAYEAALIAGRPVEFEARVAAAELLLVRLAESVGELAVSGCASSQWLPVYEGWSAAIGTSTSLGSAGAWYLLGTAYERCPVGDSGPIEDQLGDAEMMSYYQSVNAGRSGGWNAWSQRSAAQLLSAGLPVQHLVHEPPLRVWGGQVVPHSGPVLQPESGAGRH